MTDGVRWALYVNENRAHIQCRGYDEWLPVVAHTPSGEVGPMELTHVFPQEAYDPTTACEVALDWLLTHGWKLTSPATGGLGIWFVRKVSASQVSP